MTTESAEEPVQPWPLDSFAAVARSEALDGAVEEQDVQTARSPGNVAIVPRVLVVLVFLVGLVVLATQYDKSAVWRDRVSTWWGAFSTVQPPIESSSSIPRIPETPEVKLPTDSNTEKVVPDSVFELETRQTVEPGLTATEAEDSLELEAAVPVQQQGADVQSEPEVATEETSNLPDEASLDNPVQGTAMTLEDNKVSQPGYPIHSKEPVQASVPATATAFAEENGAGDSTAASIIQATEHVLHVQFGFDSAEYSNGSQGVLERALELLNSAQGSRALITGYSDSQGKELYNIRLSRRRAETVARYLVDKGIQRKRLQVEGRGAIQVSVNTGAQESLPSYNDWRIVEIRISLPGEP